MCFKDIMRLRNEQVLASVKKQRDDATKQRDDAIERNMELSRRLAETMISDEMPNNQFEDNEAMVEDVSCQHLYQSQLCCKHP